MTRFACLPFCLALVVLTGSSSAQVSPDSVSIDMFLADFNLTGIDGLQDSTSTLYKNMTAEVQEQFSSIGGQSESIVFSLEDGCLKIHITWINGNQSILASIMDKTKADGLTIRGSTWKVSFTGCSEASMLMFRFYVESFPWSDNLVNHTSMEYQTLFEIVANTFVDLGGTLSALELAQNSGCVEFYVEWRVLNSTNILDQMSTLTTKGIVINNKMYTVLSKACTASAEDTLLKFSFYVTNVTWSDNFVNHESLEYLGLKETIQFTFSNLGGNIRSLEVAKNYGCLQVYVEWNAKFVNNILQLMSALKENGITIMDQIYTVQTKPCELTTPSVEDTLLKFSFYVTNVTWSDNFVNHESLEYLGLKETIQSTFSNLGGNMRSLEVAKNYGCLQIYVEWNAEFVNNILQLMSTLKENGITIMDQIYTVQTKPCELSASAVDECPENPKGMFGICIEKCSDSIEGMNCSAGFKCCSNGCGRICKRVGYTLTINTTVIIDLTWTDSLTNTDSSMFSQIQMAAQNMIKRSFNVEYSSMIAGVQLMKMSRYTVEDKSITLLDLLLYFTENEPNEHLEPGRARLMSYRFTTDNTSSNVIDVHLGSNSENPFSICGGTKCSGICKQLRSDIQYCSCNSGYGGSGCTTFDCSTEMSALMETNNSLCQNGGQCMKTNPSSVNECLCQPGYTGLLCQVNLNACPPVLQRPKGLIGLCRSLCMDGDCKKEEMCCKVSCGGNACVEVGYLQKMAVKFTIDFPFTSDFNDTNHPMYQMLKAQLENWINSFITTKNILGYKSAKFVNAQPSTDEQVTRRKRQNIYTVVNLELQFTNVIPVESLKDIILTDSFNENGFSLTVSNLSYGLQGGCPTMACAPGSFCVTTFGGGLQCACPKSKSGQLCEVFDCEPGDTNLCQNGGTCSYSNTDMKKYCECPRGYSGKLCEEEIDVCAMGLCINGGKCFNLKGGNHYCDCPEGFSGTVCENAANHCPLGKPLMTTSGERHCFRQQCPVGFYCNVDPLDRWTACCYQQNFLCDLKPCQAEGECVFDFNSGAVCNCPQGRGGLFCEEPLNGTVKLTACQLKERFHEWMINILKTGTPVFGITLEDVRVILQHLGYTYLSTNMCDSQGNFKSVAEGVLVVNPTADKVQICFDKSGNYNPDCGAAICDVLSNNIDREFCMNGGNCLGEITEKLCDCNGTGYHGIWCELKGETVNETSCTLRRDIAYLAIGILNGSVNLMADVNMKAALNATKNILQLYRTDNIFVPYCDANGQYEYRGCLVMAEDTSRKICYCALDDGSKFGEEESSFVPPSYCRISDSCPEEWGTDCVQPDWWCSENMQCQPFLERCAYYTKCTNDMCTLETEVACVAKNIVLPCDLHTCEDDHFSMCQPCGLHGLCYNVGEAGRNADIGYRCECKTGFTGPECEINENVCSHIPRDLCESHCIGDLSQGKLCQCDIGYGGIFCDMPARSLCERQKALFDDGIKILKGEISPWNGYSVADMQAFVAAIINEEDGEEIPVLNCTENGFYYKVQCMVSINDVNTETCHCVDVDNNPISSNVKPYIGYDICTAASDSQELAHTACNVPEYLDLGELAICQNGGTCIFEIYAGKFCLCPDGYYGLYCQYKGNNSGSADPRSLCEFFAHAWEDAYQITNGNADWITNDLERQLYLNLSLNFLQLRGNQSIALKAECHDDGTFKPAACYYNLKTNEKETCYCWNLRGILLEEVPVASSDSDECSKMADDSCPLLNCRDHCEHGYRFNNIGCRSCDCKNPCEDIVCDKGQRCVISKSMDCHMDDMQSQCTKAACVSAHKTGICPGYSQKLFRSGGLLEAVKNCSSNSVTCYDDTDCEGNKKCCGICGSICVNPQVPYNCQDYKMKVDDYLSFTGNALDELRTTRTLSPADIRMLERIINMNTIWLNLCDDRNPYLFKHYQCELEVDEFANLGKISTCFCVDVNGNKIEGAKADMLDPTSCDIKPFSCPFVEPSQSDEDTLCNDDYDCVGGEKCCGQQGNQICQRPIDTSLLTTTFDQLMSTLCVQNSNMCQGGSQCVNGSWEEMGIVCDCPSNRIGPFCEQLVSDATEVPKTACQRKSLALKVFIEQIQQTNKSLSFQKLLDSVSRNDMEFEITSAVWYNCTPEGEFHPTQCVVNAYDRSGDLPRECFCVYEDGTEILGTRTPIMDSLFCGTNNMTCPIGNAYHNDSGELHECVKKDDCPMGYSCHRSTYGKLYCCLTKEGLHDVCKQPKDIGTMCPSGIMPSGTQYYYDDKASMCMDFSYHGCQGNNNRFSTMTQCTDLCIKNIHQGTCSLHPVKVTVRSQCPDLCDEDDDCDMAYKCCSSTCGKRCIPTGDGAICPVGQHREAKDGGKCSISRPCETGYMCITSGNYTGFCCSDYSNIDQCLIAPSVQSCQNYEVRYFYNATIKMCQKFNYGGCHPDVNNFKTLEECCATCNGEGRCKKGMCPRVSPGSVATCMSECNADGDCNGKMICCSNGCGKTCVVPDVEELSHCLSQQMNAMRFWNIQKSTRNSSDCDTIYIPKCEKDGTWAKEQCQTAMGICWCVSPQGNYVNNTMTKGVPRCQTVSTSMIMRADQSKINISHFNYNACENGKDFHCCSKELCSQKCYAYPQAVCHINPCGACKAEYYTEDGRMVNCSKGLSMCQLELKNATADIQGHRLNVPMATDKGTENVDKTVSRSETPIRTRSLTTVYPARCQLPPETGSCKGFLPQWYFDASYGKCNMFTWGMCEGNENRFNSPDECYANCSPTSNPCLNISCNVANTMCQLQYDADCYMSKDICNITAACTATDPESYLAQSTFVPSCQETGEYSYKQCHGSYCWCVNSEGQYVNGLTMEQRFSLICSENGTIQSISANDGICPSGSRPNINCMKACTNQVCPGNPEAVCVVDLCSSTCKIKFIDASGQNVMCTDDKCQVFSFNEQDTCSDKCPASNVKICPESVCELAMKQNCSKKHCAVCVLDPCTCQPSFIDVRTRKSLTNVQCNYLSESICELKRCDILSNIEKAKFSGIDLTSAETALPECDDHGKFNPKQCQGQSCQCVDQFGRSTGETSAGSCREIDEIVILYVTLTYNANYNEYKSNDKLKVLQDMIWKKLQDAGIDPRIIKKVGEPYPGSVKVDVTFQNNADSYNKDMALITNTIKQMANTNGLDLTIDGQTVNLVNITEQVQTQSQVADNGNKIEDEDELSQTEKIIIGVVVGVVGLLIIAVIVFCLCYRRKQQKEAMDDSFETIRESKRSSESSLVSETNKVYQEDDNIVKVRL